MPTAKVKSPCAVCKNEQSNQEILFSEERSWENKELGIGGLYQWQTLKCAGCDTVSFRKVEWFSEDYDPETGKEIPTIKYYPSWQADALPIKPFQVPPLIVGIYRETVDAYNRRSYILCTAGLRVAIEAICLNKRIKRGPVTCRRKGVKSTSERKSLQGRINGLVARGFITQQLADSLHHNRVFGNEAVHELKVPRPEELRIAIGLLEHTIEHVYDVPGRLGQLKALRKKRNKRI